MRTPPSVPDLIMAADRRRRGRAVTAAGSDQDIRLRIGYSPAVSTVSTAHTGRSTGDSQSVCPRNSNAGAAMPDRSLAGGQRAAATARQAGPGVEVDSRASAADSAS